MFNPFISNLVEHLIGHFFVCLFRTYSERNTALRYAQNQGLIYASDGRFCLKDESEFENVCYPKKLDKYIKGYISHVRIPN